MFSECVSVQVSFSRVEKFNEENSSLSPSSGMFVVFTDVSGQPVGCILHCLTLENGTDRPFKKSVNNYQHKLL